MKIEYHRKFLKAFKKLDKKLQAKVVERVEIFKDDPYARILKIMP